MSVFEEPLAAHYHEEPVLIHAIEIVAIPWRNELMAYAAISFPDGRGSMIAFEDLVVDWRYLETEQRWHDLADLKGLQDAAEAETDDGSSPEA